MNSKLTVCPFCAHSLDDSALLLLRQQQQQQETATPDNVSASITAATALKDRLVAADSDAHFKHSLQDLDAAGWLTSLQFLSAGEVEANREAVERARERIERANAQKGTFSLCEMIFADEKDEAEAAFECCNK